MKIQTKTAILISISCLLIFGALHLAASCLILPSYQDIENKLSQDGVCQTLTTLQFRLSQMESQVIDYAAWNDSYNFVQVYDQAFADANLDTAFENLNLNIIATMDTAGNLIYCKSYDHNYSEPIISGKETTAQLQSDKTIWNLQSVDEVKSGLMLLDEKILLVATAPVVTSQKNGPIKGGMLFGNYLNQQEIQQLSAIMGLNFTVSLMVDFEKQTGGDQIVKSLTANPQVVLVKASSSEVISGYTLIDDIHGEPLFVLQVNQPRDSYNHGIVTRNMFIACSLILSVTFGASFLVILKKQIITPLTNLATYVKNNFSETNSTKIASKQKTDEVSVLAGAIRDSLNQKMETMNEVHEWLHTTYATH
ncbi:MAG: CHASE4 domain-containing protein [Candidatus Bathyarchaeia archaeon]|jgi:sensor domain CHASE-containing protein